MQQIKDVAESDEEGKVEIKATNGICRAQLSFATKPSKLVIVVKKWSEALEVIIHFVSFMQFINTIYVGIHCWKQKFT